MSENDFFEPQLTRKEIKLIKLLRMQSEEHQKEIAENVNRLFEDHKKIISDRLHHTEDEQDAFWLNSEYYKK